MGRLKTALGYGQDPLLWEVPGVWMPAGRHQRYSERTLSIDKVRKDAPDCDAESVLSAWTDILRIGLVRSMVPARIGGVATASTVLNELKLASRVASACLVSGTWNGQICSSVDDDLGTKVLKAHGWRILRSTLHHLYLTGYATQGFHPRKRRNGTNGEINRFGAPALSEPIDEARSWQPLPDAFVAECGWRVAWIIRNLGPPILGVLETIADLDAAPLTSKGRPYVGHSLEDVQRDRRKQIVISSEWTAADGSRMVEMPFSVLLTRRLNPGMRIKAGVEIKPFAWPPCTYHEILLLANLLQTAHAFVMLLSAGPRATEVLSYEEDCVDESVSGLGRIRGRTYKMEKAEDGRERDFPAPAFVIAAARQQRRLARVVKKIASGESGDSFGNHLWVQVTKIGASKQGSPLKDLNYSLGSMVKTLDLGRLLDATDPACHTHRFRKTLARLVALALVNAQMILMDCFGHADPEMTLIRYILSDRRIHADVIRVQRELVILLAEETIQSADEVGGIAGDYVRERRDERLMRLGKDELDPKDVRELAEALTMDGRSWLVVGPGIICALPPGASGPCSRQQSGRNPAYCRSGCQNQILTAYSKTETEDTLAFLVEELRIANDEGNEILVAQWRGQITSWIYRWRDVYEKWSSHELIAEWIVT